jgi:hypothetical protein
MKLMELYQDKIRGAIRGLDRIRFRGTLRLLANQNGLRRFMSYTNILLKDFSGWVENLTGMIRKSCEARADELGIETRYLRSSRISKEDLARSIAAEKGIKEGSICLFSVVEPCISPMVKGNKSSKKLEVVMANRKCVWLYHYFNHPEFGFGHGQTPKEIISDYRKRYEGVRVKHWVNHNSVKMYNKSGSILRVETTINNSRDFKVYRHPDDDKSRPASWQKMRKGVSDLHRRCEISDKCNERYADTLAAVQVEEKLKEVLSPACNKVNKKGNAYRGLNPWQEEDYKLLTFLAKGEHAISGFRNKDLRRWLYAKSEAMSKQEQKRYSGRTTRRIKLLRAHGLIKKVAKENRYMLTAKGQKFACALMTASAVDIKGLTKIAA